MRIMSTPGLVSRDTPRPDGNGASPTRYPSKLNIKSPLKSCGFSTSVTIAIPRITRRPSAQANGAFCNGFGARKYPNPEKRKGEFWKKTANATNHRDAEITDRNQETAHVYCTRFSKLLGPRERNQEPRGARGTRGIAFRRARDVVENRQPGLSELGSSFLCLFRHPPRVPRVLAVLSVALSEKCPIFGVNSLHFARGGVSACMQRIRATSCYVAACR